VAAGDLAIHLAPDVAERGVTDRVLQGDVE
jgi:hypothetical protein